MSIAKRLIQQSIENRSRKGGYTFVNYKPQATFTGKGVYSGVTGRHLLSQEINIEDFNTDVTRWGKDVLMKLKPSAAAASVKGKGELVKSLKVNFKKEDLQIVRVGFGMARHGVFLVKGVGRGYVMSGDTVKRTAMGPSDNVRKPKDWFNRVLDPEIAGLQNILIKHTGDAVVLNINRIFIK